MLSARGRALLGGVVWVAIGVMLIWRGFPYWAKSETSSPGWALWAVVLGLVIGGAKGVFVLRKSAARMIRRIESRPGRAPFWQIYPPYLYLLIPVMIGMGLALKSYYGESKPSLVLGVYVGIGAALLCSSFPFFGASARLRSAGQGETSTGTRH